MTTEVEEEAIITSAATISRMLAMLNWVMKIMPFINNIIPNIRINPDKELKLKIPNTQKISAMNISANPKIFNIMFKCFLFEPETKGFLISFLELLSF